MAQPNYKQVETLLAAHQPFKHGHSMSAERADDQYYVWSYSTLIASCNITTGEWWLNETKYSRTTSKQQNIIRRVAFGGSRGGVTYP